MRLLRVLSIGSLALASACGGSGDGGGNPALDNSLFAGSYFASVFGGSMTVAVQYAATLAGPWTANGDGTGSLGFTLLNRNTSLLGLPPPVAATNLVAADGTFTATIGTDTYVGGVRAAGDVLALANVTAGDEPAMLLALRSDGVFSTASLVGTYHLGALSHSGGAQVVSVVGQVSFDGLGSMTATGPAASVNANGVVGSAVFASATYSVAADGRMTLSGVGGSFTGAVLAGGDLALLAGSTSSGQAPSQAILIRSGGGLGDATFDGSYWVAGLQCTDPPSAAPAPRFVQVTALHGSASANGAGFVSYPLTTLNVETAILTQGSSHDYTVSADGTLTSIVSALPVGRGAISPDGRFAFLCGDVGGLLAPRLLFFARK